MRSRCRSCSSSPTGGRPAMPGPIKCSGRPTGKRRRRRSTLGMRPCRIYVAGRADARCAPSSSTPPAWGSIARPVSSWCRSVSLAGGGASVLHLACHGRVVPDSPVESYLEVAAGERLILARILAQAVVAGASPGRSSRGIPRSRFDRGSGRWRRVGVPRSRRCRGWRNVRPWIVVDDIGVVPGIEPIRLPSFTSMLRSLHWQDAEAAPRSRYRTNPDYDPRQGSQ